MTFRVSLDYDAYSTARESFKWDIPDNYNIARDLLRKHAAQEEQIALYQLYPDGSSTEFTFAELDERSNQLAHAFTRLGVQEGDRVGVVLPQRPENPLVHLA